MRKPTKKVCDQQAVTSAVIVGAGAIGSWAGEFLARSGQVQSVLIVDPQTYESSNVRGQNVLPGDAGRGKAQVLARKMRQINPKLQLSFEQCAVEDLPLGRLKNAVILGALDNRGARRYLNQAAHWLGCPWYIDAGVEASECLARVSVFQPSPRTACLQCPWDSSDYQLLETKYPCRENDNGARPTNAPAALGSIAAGLQSLELEKIRAHNGDAPQAGRQITYCLSTHRSFITKLQRNPKCLCDHGAWKINALKLPPQSMVEKLIQTTGGDFLRVEGRTFTSATICMSCGLRKNATRLVRRLRPCTRCGGPMMAPGNCQFDSLPAMGISLGSLGLATGDIVAVQRGKKIKRYELIFHGGHSPA